MGVSGRAMLAAIVEGNSKPELMAELAKGTMGKKYDLRGPCIRRASSSSPAYLSLPNYYVRLIA